MRNNRFSPLKEVLDEMIRDMRLGSKMEEMHIRKHWNREMGAYITKNTQKLFFRDGVLYVHVTSSALRQELFMARDKIRQLLNERVGSDLIREVVIRS